MRIRTHFHGVLAAALFLAASVTPALAAGEVHTHDGFFLRLSAGVAAARAEISDPTGKLEVTGTAGDLNLAVGGVIAPNLALHGTLWGWSASDPDGELTITGSGTGSGKLNGTLTLSAIGVGATYYFMPGNFYLSCSVGMASLNGDGDLEGKTKPGFAFDATLGKEWWAGDAWGLGLAGDVGYFSSKDDTILGLDESWSGPSYGLRFSATFN